MATLLPTPLRIEPLAGHISLALGLRYVGPNESTARRILGAAWRDTGTPIEVVPAAHPGYSLHIDSALGIRIECKDAESERHALATLARWLRVHGQELSCARIEDRPAVATRGVMLDISRDRIPTMATLRALVDRMELMKLNHLQLYTEHAFAYAGHEDVWSGCSPMTPAEARELDAYCRERGVELAANQNCLGHLHRWLRLPRYEPLAEIPASTKEWTFETDDGRAFTKTGPHSLCPIDPRSLALIDDLLGQLLPCFSSALVNIGCDEAFDVGQGRSRDEVARRGRAAVYFDWLRRVDRIAQRHGKRSLFWADIAWRHPAMPNLVPEGATPLVWGYEADSFDRLDGAVGAMRDAGMRPWFCPGTSAWLSITGRSTNRSANIRAAARRATGDDAGVLCCDWGDRGHRQQWPIGLMGIAQAAHESWTGADPARPFDPAAAGALLLGDARAGEWIDELGRADAELSAQAELRNTNALFTELHRAMEDRPADPRRHGQLEDWRTVHARLLSLRDRLPALSVEALVRAELEHTLSIATHAAEKAIVSRACLDEPGGLPRGPARIRLAAELASLMEEHRALWVKRSREGGLDESCAHYERVVEDYERG